ncbi:MAG: Uma2 family endonuclease [Acidobacteria bacterium]|nr:Uma2 family endonuclease [Acidobacteriota bacterium]
MAQSTTTINETPPSFISLNIQSLDLSEEQFELLCRDNRDMRIELTAEGELLIMPPTGYMSGWRNSNLNYQLVAWSKANGTGICFDSSTLFTLPNGAKRSPDVSWIRLERCNALTEDEKEGFAPICPDFVIELRSPTDRLSTLQDKMLEYMENGAQLGWLIDPKSKQVFIYRPNQPVECLDNPATVSGELVLQGFVLNLAEIW